MPPEPARITCADAPAPFRAIGGPAAIAEPTEGADGKKALGTFTGNAYTGAPMTPGGWYGRIIVDLAGVRVPSQHRPVLRQHDAEQIVGHTTEVKVGAEGIAIAGTFSGQAEHVAKVVEPARNGFQWQLSIGATPVRTEYLESGEETEVNGRTVSGPLTISRETELGEISFVPLGADGDTSATVSASREIRAMNTKALLKFAKSQGVKAAQQYSDEDIDKMSDDEAKAALKKCMKGDDDTEDKAKAKAKAADDEGAGDGDDAEKKTEARIAHTIAAATQKGIEAARKAHAEENARITDIRARVARYNVGTVEIEANGTKGKVDLVSHAIAAGWTADQAELHALRNARPGGDVGGPTVYVTNKPELNEAVLEAAVLHAARHQFKLEDDSFYFEASPDGKSQVRRIPEYLQREAQGGIKARYTDQVQQAAHTIFRGRVGPQEILSRCFRANGSSATLDLKSEPGVRSALEEWHHMERPGIRAEGTSNLSISNILANVMNKFALQGYLFTEQAWREICAVRPVNDFKPSKSINLLGDVMYSQIGPAGELANASLTDQAFANQAQMFGRILTLPWMHIVNDDLGILTGAPQKIGQGAGLALNDQIWKLWAAMAAGTVNGDDGNPFWRTTSAVTAAAMKAGTAYRPNKMSGGGSALSLAAMQTAKALFDNQIDPNGNPLGFDGLKPVLLFGPSNWQAAMNILYASALVYGGSAAGAAAPNFNPFQGYFNPVMSRYIESPTYVNSATPWWVLFNPAALAAIEVCFLNGVDTPAVLQAGPDYQFDRLGISIRGTMPFGSNQQNFRGGVYSVGA